MYQTLENIPLKFIIYFTEFRYTPFIFLFAATELPFD